MTRFNLAILCISALFCGGCLSLSSYGVDPILKNEQVKEIMSHEQDRLLAEYNDSHRHSAPVTDVDLELIKKSWDSDHKEVSFDFSQQVRDEFGKRITLFEKRIVRLTLINEGGWRLVAREFR